jgi:tetratricopeptide (TPR) repeat protein
MMRRTGLAAVFIAAGAAVAASEPGSRIDILEQWLTASAQHEPGTADHAAEVVAEWSVGQLRTLWVDLTSLTTLMRRPEAAIFQIKTEGRRVPDTIRYSSSELARLRVLARAASGTLGDDAATPELRALSRRASAANLHSDGNDVLKRGALLHADLAMAGPFIVEAPNRRDRWSPGPWPMRFLLQDGQPVDMGYGALHWEIARLLLDRVLPRPAADGVVQSFYHATGTYLQREGKYEVAHLQRARELFPGDAMILFLSGCQHEAFAGPPVQSVVQTTSLPYGVSFGVDTPGVEWRRAERYFRRALQLDPALDGARLRHGRVLGMLERHSEALAELQQVIDTTSDPLLRYYAELFIGAEHEALGRLDAARESYQRAAAGNARAQAPHLALSQLARRTGDRTAALRELQQVFDIGATDGGPEDPWWFYSAAAGRRADDLLEQLWRGFRSEPSGRP